MKYRAKSKVVVPQKSATVFVEKDVVGAMTRSRSRKRPRLQDMTNKNDQKTVERRAKVAKKSRTKATGTKDKTKQKVATSTGNSVTSRGVKNASASHHVSPLCSTEGRSATAISSASMRSSKDSVMVEPTYKNIDEKFQNNPLYVTEYVNDMFQYFLSAENHLAPKMDYMRDVQSDINAQMRGILVDWLVEVGEEYKLLPQTLFLCINLIDRCLSKLRVSRSKLQLLGCACMLLASKYEEIYAPQVDEFVYISDNTYTDDQVRDMESKVLNVLGFQLTVPTVVPFLTRFLRAADATKAEKMLAKYLSEISLLSYSLLKFRPSIIAASAIYLARYILRHNEAKRETEATGVTNKLVRYIDVEGAHSCWSSTLDHYTGGLNVVDIQSCVQALNKAHIKVQTSNLKAVREKYSDMKRFLAIAQEPPVPMDALPDVEALRNYRS